MFDQTIGKHFARRSGCPPPPHPPTASKLFRVCQTLITMLDGVFAPRPPAPRANYLASTMLDGVVVPRLTTASKLFGKHSMLGDAMAKRKLFAPTMLHAIKRTTLGSF